MVFGAAGFFLWMHRWIEREEILTEAKQIHQKRIEIADKFFAPGDPTGALPKLRDGASIGVRSTD